MIELDKIYNEDCLIGMQRIPDGSVDAVICDLPYGTIQGTALNWRRPDDDKCLWDETLPTEQLFAEYGRVLRRGGVAVLFSQEPYTSHLRTYNGTWLEFCYPCYWKKEHAGNILLAKKAPVNYIEDINVFIRRSANDADKKHPLRPYARKVLEFIGKNCGEVQADFRRWNIPKPTRVAHFLSPDGLQFLLCTEETYKILIERYGIDKMQDFRTWEDLKAEEEPFIDGGRRTFNLPEGQKSMSNVFEFSKEFENIHPTQKPVSLIRRLVLTYTNEGDTVLDNCSGSGTTAVACIKEKRHFICFEKDEIYWKKSVERVKNEQRQLTLF